MKSLDPDQQEWVEDWDARGRPDCGHEEYEKHRMPPHGADTGDYICTRCGADWHRDGPKPGPQAAATYLDSTLD